MRIALTGTEDYAIEFVGRELRQAGHFTVNCHDRCRERLVGTESGDPETLCPARDGVEAVIAVRAHPLPSVTTREARILGCPFLRDVPLMIAGCPVPNPFGEQAVAMAYWLEHVDVRYHGRATGCSARRNQ